MPYQKLDNASMLKAIKGNPLISGSPLPNSVSNMGPPDIGPKPNMPELTNYVPTPWWYNLAYGQPDGTESIEGMMQASKQIDYKPSGRESTNIEDRRTLNPNDNSMQAKILKILSSITESNLDE